MADSLIGDYNHARECCLDAINSSNSNDEGRAPRFARHGGDPSVPFPLDISRFQRSFDISVYDQRIKRVDAPDADRIQATYKQWWKCWDALRAAQVAAELQKEAIVPVLTALKKVDGRVDMMLEYVDKLFASLSAIEGHIGYKEAVKEGAAQ